MATKVKATRERLWLALTDAEEVEAWGPGGISGIALPADYPRRGQRVRWKTHLGRVPLPMDCRVLEVDRTSRLKVELRSGLLRAEVCFTLHGDRDEAQLGMRLVLPNAIPIVGGLLDRFAVRELASEGVDLALVSLRHWCED